MRCLCWWQAQWVYGVSVNWWVTVNRVLRQLLTVATVAAKQVGTDGREQISPLRQSSLQ